MDYLDIHKLWYMEETNFVSSELSKTEIRAAMESLLGIAILIFDSIWALLSTWKASKAVQWSFVFFTSPLEMIRLRNES